MILPTGVYCGMKQCFASAARLGNCTRLSDSDKKVFLFPMAYKNALPTFSTAATLRSCLHSIDTWGIITKVAGWYAYGLVHIGILSSTTGWHTWYVTSLIWLDLESYNGGGLYMTRRPAEQRESEIVFVWIHWYTKTNRELAQRSSLLVGIRCHVLRPGGTRIISGAIYKVSDHIANYLRPLERFVNLCQLPLLFVALYWEK